MHARRTGSGAQINTNMKVKLLFTCAWEKISWKKTSSPTSWEKTSWRRSSSWERPSSLEKTFLSWPRHHRIQKMRSPRSGSSRQKRCRKGSGRRPSLLLRRSYARCCSLSRWRRWHSVCCLSENLGYLMRMMPALQKQKPRP